MDSSIVDQLVYDRRQSDVDHALLLKEKYDKNEASASEKLELLYGNIKGVYSTSDANRVESCVQLLADMLANMPDELQEYAESKNVAWSSLFDVSYNPEDYSDIVTKTDWDYMGQFFGSDIALSIFEDQDRYIGNIQKLVDAFDFEHEPVPQTLNRLTYWNANLFEELLKRVYNEAIKERSKLKKYIDSVTIGVFSGEYASAEVPFCQEN